ncbi:ComEA family DNA-binding protein [Aquimarina pacifica]|uniref:ComEA family DNA-binding protein n=1 Tax=Aquimarina pacifica TaxID=1296415 RepID=UPI0005520BC0|nr:helix-hairpin-helix domain-containing protein [Aquimarina pacifica]
MKINKESHFEIHARFRNGIFLLSIVLLISSLTYYYHHKSINSPNDFVELTRFQQQIDSLKALTTENKEDHKLSPFNPNFISDYKGYVLGLSVEELDRLREYRRKQKWINSSSDFKEVTQVSDSLLVIISPLFRFPKWIKENNEIQKNTKKKYSKKSFRQKKDLNTVTAHELQADAGIPDFIAHRVVSYRESIGGFVSDLQLKDVRGLYENKEDVILSNYTVKKPKEISLVPINTASVKELLEVPYFDFETSLDIRDFIKEHGPVSNFQELEQIKSFSFEKIERIKLYLTLD